ncbi:hypothetical protein EGH21_19620 [Halomicroarcula sp. F13]|uniref:Secreted protein n=1 Tax=Haloarcula rubra TaxID=2487747 RepID=A0AAW4PX56_9EURY|nr:hypothetical protein [Halomicroarcula rubra]MBX0325239.1 hypothetical protein [Halomicroarcula rubra]
MVELLVAAGAAVAALVVGSAGGFITGRKTAENEDDGPALQAPAERLNQPPNPQAVTEAVETLTETIYAVVDATALNERDNLQPEDSPVETAEEVRRAAERGTLTQTDPHDQHGQAPGGSESETDTGAEPKEVTPAAITGAVSSVRGSTTAETASGQRLLEYLSSADKAPERKLTETLDNVVTTLNHHAAVESALQAIKPHVEPRELGRTLDRRTADVEGELGDALETIAVTLSTVAEEREECESEREELVENAERVCTAANEQTTIAFDSSVGTAAWLASLADRLDDGSISFADQENSLHSVASRLDLAPESTLGREFVDVLTSEAISQQDSAETLRSVVATIDRAETTGHRLDGLESNEVARLAERLADEFESVDSPVGSVLRERASELQSTVRQAGKSDLVTIYAARQELRFYDHRLLKQVQTGGGAGGDENESELQSLTDEVEQRRSTMRTQYPSDYPQHDHSIPIHFLELVSSLQEAATDARASGNKDRAVGYLKAADKTLDWVAELYDRHAYSVLLEQLRG